MTESILSANSFPRCNSIYLVNQESLSISSPQLISLNRCDTFFKISLHTGACFRPSKRVFQALTRGRNISCSWILFRPMIADTSSTTVDGWLLGKPILKCRNPCICIRTRPAPERSGCKRPSHFTK